MLACPLWSLRSPTPRFAIRALAALVARGTLVARGAPVPGPSLVALQGFRRGRMWQRAFGIRCRRTGASEYKAQTDSPKTHLGSVETLRACEIA
jgi:hypothetical protein